VRANKGEEGKQKRRKKPRLRRPIALNVKALTNWGGGLSEVVPKNPAEQNTEGEVKGKNQAKKKGGRAAEGIGNGPRRSRRKST